LYDLFSSCYGIAYLWRTYPEICGLPPTAQLHFPYCEVACR